VNFESLRSRRGIAPTPKLLPAAEIVAIREPEFVMSYFVFKTGCARWAVFM
jgi:hypothetical protein